MVRLNEMMGRKFDNIILKKRRNVRIQTKREHFIQNNCASNRVKLKISKIPFFSERRKILTRVSFSDENADI